MRKLIGIVPLVFAAAACNEVVVLEPENDRKVAVSMEVVPFEPGISRLTFSATALPADTLYWEIRYPNAKDQIVGLGMEIPERFRGTFTVKEDIAFRNEAIFALDFLAWTPRSDTARVRFVNP